MIFHRKKVALFYVPCQEIPAPKREKERYMDAATQKSLKTASGRMILAAVIFIFCLCIVWGRLFYLTVLNYNKRPTKSTTWHIEENLPRYNIVDRNGTVLATTLTSWDISVNPTKVKDPKEVAHQLATKLEGVKESELLEKLTSDSNFKYIKRGATPKELEAINWLGYHFLTYEAVNKRAYPQGALFSHILGGVNIDNVGIAGIEKAYDEDLKEHEIQLSLDVSVQEMVRTNLKNGIQKYKAEGGLGMVIDINTGEMLASVSLPDYDPEVPAGKDTSARFNMPTLGVYEFGSVFKLFNTAMALENKVIKITDKVDASHPLKVGKKTVEDFHGQNRPLTVTEVLIHSSNIGSAKIALQAGYEKQRDFLKKFNMYDKLSIPLPERGTPLYNTKDKWAEIESVNVSFGYGIAVTPLHLLAGVAALTNGGFYNTPTFIKDGNKNKATTQVLDNVISEQLRHMMWAVINWDPWTKNPAKHYAVGGKTGTANMKEGHGYNTDKVRTSFVGVFPVNDPKYAVQVTLLNPKGIKETFMFNNAGWNAKMVGLNIINEIAPYLNIAPVFDYQPPEFVQKSIDISLIKNGRKKKE
ncbi:MAG: penicillin-binding protein 2 [Alphaproteobacteria bacterium]|nr:penicillin-binding protein 2 [Alphaproteobacteria bacterium]